MADSNKMSQQDTIRMDALSPDNSGASSTNSAKQAAVKKKTHSSSKPKRTPRKRWAVILLAVLKYTYIPLICVAALVVGLIVGYVKIGGHDLSDVWKWGTWKHLYDLVFAK